MGGIALAVYRALNSARLAARSETCFMVAQDQLKNVANDGLMISSVVSPGQATVYFDARSVNFEPLIQIPRVQIER